MAALSNISRQLQPPWLGRRTFLKTCAVLGLVGPLAACTNGGPDPDGAPSASGQFTGKVLIIGAGAAGMSAGHLLARAGVEFEIVEAGPSYGGRIKHTRDFVDFPISLGGEWLHSEAGELDKMAGDTTAALPNLAAYDPADSAGFYDGELELYPSEDTDLKFVDSSWLGFFETLILPGIADRMVFDTQVVLLDHSGPGIVATDRSGTVYEADAAIVTVPITVLRDGDIEFVPPLPDQKTEALQQARIWSGMKVFIEFSENFYPATLALPDSATDEGQRLYYDAAYGQDSDHNVLGLFSVGAQALPYQSRTGDELLSYVLAELDQIFDGAASRTYIRHISQNWDDEPFIRQAYLADNALSATSRTLAESIGDRLFFAGDAYTKFDNWSEVHVAARSARDAVADLLG